MKSSANPNSFAEYCESLGIKPIKAEKLHYSKAKSLISINNFFPPKTQIDNAHYNLFDDPLYHQEYCNDGQKHIISKLKNSKYHVVASIDLHQLTQSEALNKLTRFIDSNLTVGNTCLKIIHGKGLNSPDGKSVLKVLVRRFLEFHPRLLAYSSANTTNGGDGVTLVKLKSG